jgi:hypothetical protein
MPKMTRYIIMREMEMKTKTTAEIVSVLEPPKRLATFI